MRWLIALIAVMAFASGARAQTQAEVCQRYDTAWASALGNPAKMQQLAGNIPSYCPVRSQALRQLAQLQAQQRQRVQQRTAARTVAAPVQNAVDAQPTEVAAAAPSAPLVPCTVAAVEAQFPQIPALGADPVARPGSHDLASAYVQRAQAFSLCHHGTQAVGDLNDALRIDPHNFTAAARGGDLALAVQDYETAITDYTAAIAQAGYAPQYQDVLTAHVRKAEAEAALQRYPEEIGDLQYVTQHYNDAAHDALGSPSHYYERLAKALYRSGQPDAAANDLTDSVDATDKDAEDLQFLGQRRLAARDYAGAIVVLQQSLAKMPDDDAARPEKARLEVLLAQAYIGRSDRPEALAHFKLAEDLDPTNAEARAGHASIGDPPPPPAFEEPALQTVEMPTGVVDLTSDSPPPFCDQIAKNAYLESIAAANEVVNANMRVIGRMSDDLLKQRETFEHDPRLDFEHKDDDLGMFDDKLTRLRLQHHALQVQGDALGAFWHRINDDRSDIVGCKPRPNAPSR